jgi:hypothetical protein
VPLLEKDPLEAPVGVEVVMFEVTLKVVLAETETGEAVLADDDDVGDSEVILLVPLPLGTMIESLKEALLVVETNEGVVVVRYVPLLLDTVLIEVELNPLEVPMLNEVVLLEEVDDTLDVIVGSVAMEPVTGPDEEEEDPVEELDKVDDEVVTIEELLTVEDRLVGIELPSTQLQSVVS